MPSVEISPLDQAAYFFGSQKAMAEALGLTPNAVSLWKKRGIPLKQAVRIEKLTDKKVTKEELRPDIFSELQNV